jgi:hypothetical protein
MSLVVVILTNYDNVAAILLFQELNMFKFEMNLGWLGDGKMTVETNDFDVIEALKEFVEFQEEAGWIGNWDEVVTEEEDEVEVVTE